MYLQIKQPEKWQNKYIIETYINKNTLGICMYKRATVHWGNIK